MKVTKIAAIILILAALALSVEAQALDSFDIEGVEGEAKLAYVKTSGNTDTQTLDGSLELRKEVNKIELTLNSSIMLSESYGVETSNKFTLEAVASRHITEGLSALVTAGYVRDEFSGYDWRFYIGPGVGYDFIKTEERLLQGLVSLLYNHEEFSSGASENDDYISVKLTGKFQEQLRENVLFKEKLDYSFEASDLGRSFLDSETALEVAINSSLALGVSYIVNYQNEPPSEDIRQTDTTFLTSVIFKL